MSKKDEALKLALVAERVLKAWDDPQGMPALCEEMNCLREALAEQPAQQEPVNKYCCHLCFNKSGQVLLDRMILCPECGNKRCPKATHHELPCANAVEAKLREENA